MLYDNMDGNSKICRYIDIVQLFSMLLSESLYFCKLSELPDNNEFFYTNPIALIGLVSPKAAEDSKYLDSLRDLEPELKAKIQEIKDQLYISCWSANEDDCSLWKIFGKNNYGFCITSTIQNVINSLHLSGKQKLYHHQIKYGNSFYSEIKLIEDIISSKDSNKIIDFYAFKKIDSYKYEQEYRFIIHSTKVSEVGLSIKCNLATLINDIEISPFAPKWFRLQLNNFKTRILLGDSIERSHILSKFLQLAKLHDRSQINET